jgi:transcriptional regulator GlxA family with amidase domain
MQTDIDTRVAGAIAVMEERMARPLPVRHLAAAVNLSPSQMTRLFTEHTGTTPARYLHRLRLTRARILLERTGLTVSQVMACVGLHDPSHFSRDFRRVHGVTPTHVRDRAWR